MAFVNALGPQLFGEEYIALAPQRKDTEPVPLEVVSFPAKAKKKQHRVRAVAVGERFRALLGDPAQTIEDRHTKQARRLKGCGSRGAVSDAQHARGVRGGAARAGAPGAAAGGRLVRVAGGADRLQCALLSREPGGSACGAVPRRDGARIAHAQGGARAADGRPGGSRTRCSTQLEALAAGVAERTIYALVADAIAALGLFDTVMRWPDGEQQRANLLRLLAEAGEFMDANREALAYGGFHGGGRADVPRVARGAGGAQGRRQAAGAAGAG